MRGQRAGGDRSLAVKLGPGDLSGDQAPIVFTPVELTCLRSVGYVQALVAASCDRQVSTPHVFGPVYPPHLLRWRALRLRPQLSYWAIMHLFRTEATHALALFSTCGSTVRLQHMSVLLWHACCNHLRVGRRQHRQCSLASAARAFVLHRQMAVQTAIPSMQHFQICPLRWLLGHACCHHKIVGRRQHRQCISAC